LGDLDGAIAAYSEAVSLDPKYAEAYNNLGDALLKKGDRRRALEAYHHAFELAPNNSTLGASYEAILKQLNP
jgi:Flp pilus assembly protein TadD